jgi:predicted AAA+ superfamily ATPase
MVDYARIHLRAERILMVYYRRFADEVLTQRLKSAGAVLIKGVKSCGKTETALQKAKSEIRFDTDPSIKSRMETDPRDILPGETPRLLDEWQEYPKIWNYVRRAVDDRREKGQFILTGSATPIDDARRHSGFGRFSIMKMRPMSLSERKWSTDEVSLMSLFEDGNPKSESVEFSYEDLARKIIIGGWPGLIGSTLLEGQQYSRDAIDLFAEVDLSRVSEKRRDPIKVRQLLQSIARNISTEATLKTLAMDTNGVNPSLSKETVMDYLDALEQLMVIDDLPAWFTHIRSTDRLRQAPKKHFVDPSLAVGALKLDLATLLEDYNYLGLLFESLVIRDLKIYADANDGNVFHYRDSRGTEVDAIIEYGYGNWGAFEIKLGIGGVDEAAQKLLRFVKKVDTEKVKPPKCLGIITGNGFAHRRKDGVNVVPLSTLTA